MVAFLDRDETRSHPGDPLSCFRPVMDIAQTGMGC